MTRRYGDRTVIEELHLTLEAGEVALVEGSNGAGKTTLLRIAAGLLTPDDGYMSAFGLDPVHDREGYSRRIGLLSAGDRGLYARLTVTQNLEFFAALALVPRRARGAAIERAVTASRSSRSRKTASIACRPASDSASGSPGPSCTTRAWCSSTSRRRAWTRTGWSTCAAC